jgi:hypothetical protein
MKAFQRSRIIGARFARATPQDPLLEITSQFQRALAAAKQAAELPDVAELPNLPVVAEIPEPQSNAPEVIVAGPGPTPLIAGASKPANTQIDNQGPIAGAVEPAPSPQNPRRRVIKRSSRRRIGSSVLPRAVTSLERHQRKCVICKHRERIEIEEDFVNWCHPDEIVENYHLDSYQGLYRHAHALGLMQKRSMNLRFAAESFVEHSGRTVPFADSILLAIKMCTRINNRGEWHNPPSHVIVSSGGSAHTNASDPPAVSNRETPRLENEVK